MQFNVADLILIIDINIGECVHTSNPDINSLLIIALSKFIYFKLLQFKINHQYFGCYLY